MNHPQALALPIAYADGDRELGIARGIERGLVRDEGRDGGDTEAVVAVQEAGPAEAPHGRTDVVGELTPTAAAPDATGNVFPITDSGFGVVRAQRAVDRAAANPVPPDPSTAVCWRAYIIGVRVVLAPFHHIANHVVEAEDVRFLLPDRMGAGPRVLVLFFDPA